jgi:hypothetical protein
MEECLTTDYSYVGAASTEKNADKGVADLVRVVDELYALLTVERVLKHVALSELEAEANSVKTATDS